VNAPEFRPSDFAGRPLQDLADFLEQPDTDALEHERGKFLGRTRPPRVRFAYEIEIGETFQGLFESSTQCLESSTQHLTRDRDDTHLPATHPPISVPNVDIVEYLGGGAFGWVYSGRVKTTGLIIAVKILRNDYFQRKELLSRRAANEAVICAKLGHRNIMRVFCLQPIGDFWIILMELVQGKSLADSEISPDGIKSCFQQLANALRTMGDMRIVHRDVKPANIVLRRLDASPVLVDFGLALDLSISDPADAGIGGSPYYMPPEAFRGQITPAFDAYSLGVTAFTVVKPDHSIPIQGGSEGLIRSKLSGEFHDCIERAFNDAKPILADWILKLVSLDVEVRLRALNDATLWSSSSDTQPG
jgi:serine/threonine protein kinase